MKPGPQSKLMYYYFYHGSDLCKIIRFLLEIECNKFVLVLVQIDLIHFEHSICISSTWIKTNTNSLVQLQLTLIHIRYIKGRYIQFRVKLDTWYKSYHINLYLKWFQYSICIRSICIKTKTEISFSFWLTLFYSISLS